MTRPMLRTARQLADQQAARLAEVPSARLFFADVTAVVAAGAADGISALVTVTWRGSALIVADYPDSYTPAVGHRVRCALDGDNQLSILHRGVGSP
jgi:hypothetical protein